MDPGYDSDDMDVVSDDDDDGDDDDDDDDDDDNDETNPSIHPDSVYQNLVYDSITNEVMSQEMDVIEQLSNTCDLVCQGLHFSGEFCRHGLQMCDECGHIWDGCAQCTHPNL
jgi:hypothetical protein